MRGKIIWEMRPWNLEPRTGENTLPYLRILPLSTLEPKYCDVSGERDGSSSRSDDERHALP